MVKRISSSQFRSKMRQHQNKVRQAANKLKQELRRLESEARRNDQQRRQAVNKLNSEIRAYNNRVRANRQRLNAAVTRINSQTKIRYTVTRHSAVSLKTAYDHLENVAEAKSLGDQYNEILDYSERETANSLDVYNALEADENRDVEAHEDEAGFIQGLGHFSEDFSARWQGAVFSLSPQNPDASRHFCTSVREIFIGMIDICAPSARVLNEVPDCPVHEGKTPTRRAKIEFMLSKKGLAEPALGDFVEKDIDDILKLLTELNGGTHGDAGKFTLGQLSKLRKRVREGLEFLVMLGKPAMQS